MGRALVDWLGRKRCSPQRPRPNAGDIGEPVVPLDEPAHIHNRVEYIARRCGLELLISFFGDCRIDEVSQGITRGRVQGVRADRFPARP
jgi:hypothetical protein